MSAQRTLFLILVASFAWRALFAFILPLGTDEAYALTVGRSFSLSFFDHPPVGFWLPAFAETLGASSTFTLRLPSLILGSGTLWLLAQCGRVLGGDRAMIWTAALVALSPFAMVSGFMVLPDAPLYFGLSGTIYSLIRLAKGEDSLWLWAFGGLSLAFALASKYQAGLLPIALLIWMAVSPQVWRWFAKPGFWFAVTLSIIGLLPVLLWNYSNGWISFAFHGGRTGSELNLVNFGTMLAAQAIYLSPVVAIAAITRFGQRSVWGLQEGRLLLIVALGPILMFNIIYLFSTNTLPHWTMPGWIVIFPLLGVWLAKAKPVARRWIIWTASPIHAVLLIVTVHIETGFLTNNSEVLPSWDNTVPLVSLDETRKILKESGILEGAQLVAATNWARGGHLAAALGKEVPLQILGSDTRHFRFLDAADATGEVVLIDIARVDRSNQAGEALLSMARNFDDSVFFWDITALNRGSRHYFNLVTVRFRIGADLVDQ